jgi:hypothetical protein
VAPGPVAEASEPNEEDPFELDRFTLVKLVVRNERDVNQSECLAKDTLDLLLEQVLGSRVARPQESPSAFSAGSEKRLLLNKWAVN